MNYTEFKKLLESTPIINAIFYNKLVKKHGEESINNLFEQYIKNENIDESDEKFDRVAYYLENVAYENQEVNIDQFSSRHSIDHVKTYLNEIGTYPLLTADEELSLYKKIDEVRNLLQKRNITQKRLMFNLNKLGINYNVKTLECSIKEIEKKIEEIKINSTKMINDEVTQRRIEYLTQLIKDIKLYLVNYELTEKILNANLRLVVSVAKRYIGNGIEFLDLIQEGNIGLQKALEKFEISKGYKFSTYATWWIRQSITRAIADKSSAIRKPVHVHELITKINIVEKKLEAVLYRKPTDDEIVNEFRDMARKTLVEHGNAHPSWGEITKHSLLDKEKLKDLRRFGMAPASLQTPIGEEEDSLLIDFIEDEGASVEEIVISNSLDDYIKTILPSLSERERLVIILRFGLQLDKYISYEEFINILVSKSNHTVVDEAEFSKIYKNCSIRPKTLTLEEVGKIFNVTRERIRQVEAKALRKSRNLTRKHVMAI